MPSSSDHPPESDDLSTTAALTIRALKGDVGSLASLVVRLDPFVRAAAFHRVGPTLRRWCEPDDLVQDAWAVLCRRLPTLDFQGPGAGRALMKFLVTSMHLQIENLVRKHIRRSDQPGGVEAPTAPEELPADITSVITAMSRHEAREAVNRALTSLPDKDRELVILRGIEQHRYEDLTVITGSSAGALRTQYHRALSRLRDLLPDAMVEDFLAEV